MKRYHLAILLTFALTWAGCDSAGEDTPGPAPEPLSAEAFTLQADLFNTGTGKTAGQKAHFTAAALRVWPVSAILVANLVVPVAVTGAAVQTAPVFEDGHWTWTNTTTIDRKNYTFTLQATPVASGIDWSMFITAESSQTGPAYDHFELYTAHTTLTGESGTWHLFYPLEGERIPVLDAEFDLGGTEKVFTFSIPPGQEHAGDSVRYESTGDDRRFLWQQVAEALSHDVAWNALTRAGSIVATNYNGGDKACWDENLEDADCP